MAKPSTVPEWNTDGTNRSTPTAGQTATGIQAGEAAVSSRMNYLLNLIGQWCSYLSAGALEGDHEIDGDLVVTGRVGEAARNLWIGGNAFQPEGTDTVSHAIGSVENTTGGDATLVAPVLLPDGARITAAVMYLTPLTTSGDRTIQLRRISDTGSGTTGTIGSTTVSRSSGASKTATTLVTGLPHTCQADERQHLVLNVKSGDVLHSVLLAFETVP